MEDTLKHRLIGGALLIALAAIFLPVIFKKSHDSMPIIQQRQLAIPEPPAPPELTYSNEPLKIVPSDTEPYEDKVAIAAQPTTNSAAEPAADKEPTASSGIQSAAGEEVPTTPSAQAESVAPAAEPVAESVAQVEAPIAQPNTEAPKTVAVVKKVAAPHSKKITSPTPSRKEVEIKRAGEVHAFLPKTQKTIASAQMKDAVWVVQLASFSDRAHALSLQKKINGHGFHATIQTSKNAVNQSVYRVVVGPKADHDTASGLQLALAKKFQMKGMIVNAGQVS